jgi:hypothetical protein
MTTKTIFDFTTFYNYYTNNSNITVGAPFTMKYHCKNTIRTANNSGKYITIDGKKLYISILPPNPVENRITPALLFTIPTTINGVLWDTHYHFAVRNEFLGPSPPKGKGKVMDVVYFHKTTQTSTGKTMTNCYFLTNQDITKIENIKCLQRQDGYLSNKDTFPITGPDFAIIREIIQRPFLGVQFGGKSLNTRKRRLRKKQTRKRK